MYRFRYGRLIEVKEKLIERKQRDLESAVSAMNATAREVGVMEERIGSVFKEMCTGCHTGREFTELKDYLGYLDLQKIDLMRERERQGELVDRLRAELVNLLIDLKMLQKLRTKWESAARLLENRRGQKVMDDLGLRTRRL